MKATIRQTRQRANCVGWSADAENACPPAPGVRPSRDGHAVPVQPGHRLPQRQPVQAPFPEGPKVHGPSQFWESAAQKPGEPVATLPQPAPPASYRPAVQTRPAGAPVHRATHQQELQGQLLNRPAIPAPRRYTLWQTRARMATPPTEVAWNWDGIQRSGIGRTSIRLALITAMAPKATQPAMRTGWWPVSLGGLFQHIEMLKK